MSAGEMSTTPGLPTPGHATFEELVAGFALDALEPAEEEMLLAHLPDCERCQDALIAHQEVAASLTYALPSVEMPTVSSELAAAMASVARQLPLDPFVTTPSARRVPARSAPLPRRSLVTRQTRRVLVGAGALGIIAAVGLSGYDVHLRSTTAKPVASASQEAVQAITAPGATIEHLSGGNHLTGAAVIADGHAYLVTSGLPGTAKNSSYVVWNVDGGKPAALQRFVSAGTGSAQVVDLGAAKSTLPQSYAVTREPTSASAPLPAAPNGVYVLQEDVQTS